jgi:hypothetical protein
MEEPIRTLLDDLEDEVKQLRTLLVEETERANQEHRLHEHYYGFSAWTQERDRKRIEALEAALAYEQDKFQSRFIEDLRAALPE